MSYSNGVIGGAAMGQVGLAEQCAQAEPPRTIGQLLQDEEKRLHARLGEIEQLRCKLPAALLAMTNLDLRQLDRTIGRQIY